MFKKIIIFLAMVALAILPISSAVGWNRVERPVPLLGGVTGEIVQTDLWGQQYWENCVSEHRGADIDGARGDNVYAIATGWVVEIRENIDNDEGVDFGNYVLIKHSRDHWVRQNNGEPAGPEGDGAQGYVYSFYAHLARNSVLVDEGDFVLEGDQIAEIDNTGDSDGDHLHLQIVVSEQNLAEGGWDEDYVWSDTQSRNPELWVPPYEDADTQTATVVGRVTDQNGNPIEDVVIDGLEKPLEATAFPFNSDNDCADGDLMTYDIARENPDDIYWENFATTDIAPGTYDITADNGTYDLGQHTFRANRTTYVGLYPLYFPFVTSNTEITLYNPNFTRTANGIVTYMTDYGKGYYQTEINLSPQDVETLPKSGGFDGSVIVSSSEDLVGIAEILASTGRAAYQGVTPATGVGNPGWGRAGTTHFIPLILEDWYGWNTNIFIMNPGGDLISSSDVDATLYLIESRYGQGSYGDAYSLPPRTLPPYDRDEFKMGELNYYSGMYSAVISTDVPTAVVAVHQNVGGSWMAANSFSEDYNFADWPAGSHFNNLPQIKKNWWPNDSYIYFQNTSLQPTGCGVNLYYEHNEGDGNTYSGSSDTCAPHTSRLFHTESEPSLPDRFLGSADGGITDTSYHAASVIIEADSGGTGSSPHALYNGFVSASTTIYLPLIAKIEDVDVSGIMILNTSSSSTAHVTVTYKDKTTGDTYSESPVIAPMRSQVLWQGSDDSPVEPGFIGSAVITSDQPIVATVNVNSPLDTDGLRSYSGFNR